MTVHVEPMPAWARKTRFQPVHPPVFGGPPTADDCTLALALFGELDRESQAWYGGASFVERLCARLDRANIGNHRQQRGGHR